MVDALLGVNLAGYFRAQTGMGESARLTARLLIEAGVPFHLVEEEPPSRLLDPESIADLRQASARGELFDVNLLVVNANAMAGFVHRRRRSLLDGRRSIGRWAWEVDPMPAAMAAESRQLDAVWVYSRHERQVLERSGVSVPVRVLPLPVSRPDVPSLDRRALGLPEGFLFLFCFDADSVVERKNPSAIVQAFTRAFPRPGDASLVIKSQNLAANPQARRELIGAASGRPDVIFRDELLEPPEQAALMGTCDCYVSLHRSEGFGLTMAEAMTLGKPTIATAYSGNLEFMTEANSYLVPYVLTQVPQGCGPYPAGAMWAEPDVEVAAGFMARVTADPEEAALRGRRAAADLEQHHSLEVRCGQIRELLNEFQQQTASRPRRRRRSTGDILQPLRRSAPVRAGGRVARRAGRRLVGWSDMRAELLSVHESLESLRAHLGARPYSTRVLLTSGYRGLPTVGLERPSTPGVGYRAFEEIFRGSESLIRARQKPYLELVGAGPVADLGCGRGEFLDLLAETGVEAIGVEADETMADRAAGKGHLVVRDDLLHWLRDQPSGHWGAIVSFQVAEHLPYADLMEFISLSLSVLRPGGLFIAETVNPHSLPAMKNFWVDPTHLTPLFPETACVLCVSAGFAKAYTFFPAGATGDLDRDLSTHGEYAVVALKGPE